jgi:hypothetical protein
MRCRGCQQVSDDSSDRGCRRCRDPYIGSDTDTDTDTLPAAIEVIEAAFGPVEILEEEEQR